MPLPPDFQAESKQASRESRTPKRLVFFGWEDLRAVGLGEDGDAVGVDGVLYESRRRPRRRRELRRGEEEEDGKRQSNQSHALPLRIRWIDLSSSVRSFPLRLSPGVRPRRFFFFVLFNFPSLFLVFF